jgi:hypothetical protein
LVFFVRGICEIDKNPAILEGSILTGSVHFPSEAFQWTGGRFEDSKIHVPDFHVPVSFKMDEI